MKKLFCIVYACLMTLGSLASGADKYDALYENLPNGKGNSSSIS